MIWIVSEVYFAGEEILKNIRLGNTVGVFDNKEKAYEYMRKRTNEKQKPHYMQGWKINETIE